MPYVRREKRLGLQASESHPPLMVKFQGILVDANAI